MDHVDFAGQLAEDRVVAQLAAIRQEPKLKGAGYCHYCMEPIPLGDRFCNTDCRDDHDAEKRVRNSQYARR